MIRGPPRSTLFPSTTLSRSRSRPPAPTRRRIQRFAAHSRPRRCASQSGNERRWSRSEEHTSELQSRQYLVCRLLLEKKKNKHTFNSNIYKHSIILVCFQYII